jgi:hypothetical protein
MKDWVRLSSDHLKVIPFQVDESYAQVNIDKDPSTILIKIRNIEGIKVPGLPYPNPDHQYNLQIIFTLFSRSRGFFGRT